MASRQEFLVWQEGDSLDELWKTAKDRKIDTIPVIEDGEITRILHRHEDEPITLTADWYIQHNVSIPELVQTFAKAELSCLFVEKEQDVVGIVTPADLNKISARTYFYNLLAEIEMVLARAIRDYFKDKQERILDLLERQDKLDEIKTKMDENDMEIDIVHFLYFSELVNLLKAEQSLRDKLGFPSNKQVKNNLGGLVEWRNDVMHPVRFILDDYNGIKKLNERVQRAVSIIKQISEA